MFSPVAVGQLWQWHLPQESSPFFYWAGLFLFWGWSSWPLSGLLLERAPKCFSFHCSQHPTLPSSCEDAKDFLLNTSAGRAGMGTLTQLNQTLLFAQAPVCSHVPEFHHNISKLISSFTPFPSTATFNAALSAGKWGCALVTYTVCYFWQRLVTFLFYSLFIAT